MRALVFEGPGLVGHDPQRPDPVLRSPTDALVAVHLAGLCGSDLHPFAGREPARPGVVPGHEAVGEVVAVGDAVTAHRRGDRVLVPFTTSCGTCGPCRRGLTARCRSGSLFGWGDPDHPEVPALDGGQASLLRVPLADGTLVSVPDAVDDRTALLLTDNLPTGWIAARRAEAGPGVALVVAGAGAVGLCTVVAARALGAASVVVVEPVAGRRERALAVGADLAVAPEDAEVAVREVSGGEGADAVVDAAGTRAAQALAVGLLRPGGVLSMIAVPTDPSFAVGPADAYDRNLTLRVGRAPVRSVLDELLPRVLDGSLEVPTDLLLTDPAIPLVEGPVTYDRFAARADGMVKAAFVP